MGLALKTIPKFQIHTSSSLDQVIAWRRSGNKQLPDAMMIEFNDVYTSSPGFNEAHGSVCRVLYQCSEMHSK